MYEISPSRKPLIQAFKDFRVAADRWNFVNDKLMLYFDRHCLKYFPGIDGITQEMIDSWCIQRKSEIASSCYCRTYIIAALAEYLNKRGICRLSPPDLITPVRHRTYIPHAFTDEELTAFFNECDKAVKESKNQVMAVRRLAASVFFRLIYSTGMRTVEARLLETENVDLVSGVIDIKKSKGVDQHYVALHESTLEILKNYDQVMQAVFPKRVYFFAYSIDKPFYREWPPLVFRQIWDKVNSEHANPYDLRHNYAIRNINSWTNEGFCFSDRFLYLSKSMGHKQIESTKYYYSLIPILADILASNSQSGFDNIVPEVIRYEEG